MAFRILWDAGRRVASSSPLQSGSAIDAASALIARLEAVSFSRWHARVTFIVGSATFFDAFDILSLAFVLPVLVGLWQISPADVGVLIAVGYAGQFIGALAFGALAESRGRIPAATASVALMAVMSVGCAFAPNFATLLALRFVQGIGIGGEVPVAAVYINELSRARGRGRFFMRYQLVFPIGLMITGQIAALLVPSLGWRFLFLIGGVPGLLIALLLRRLPESPRWLIAQGRLADAEAIVETMEASAERTATVVPVVRPANAASLPPVAGSPRPNAAPGSRWRELVSPPYRHRTVVVWMLWGSAYFVTNGLNNWMPTLYNSVYHLTLQQSLRAGALTNFAQVIVLIGCASLIDRVGRRRWTVAAFGMGGLMLALLGSSTGHSVQTVIALVTLSYGAIGSVNTLLYLYTPEIYPTRMRMMGTGAATCWLRLASAVAPLLVGYLVSTRGLASAFLMFAAMSIVGAVAATRMIGTENRRLEDIAS